MEYRSNRLQAGGVHGVKCHCVDLIEVSTIPFEPTLVSTNTFILRMLYLDALRNMQEAHQYPSACILRWDIEEVNARRRDNNRKSKRMRAPWSP